MISKIFVLVAGIPNTRISKFTKRLNDYRSVKKIVSCRPLDWHEPYNARYLDNIYRDLVDELRGIDVDKEGIGVLLLYIEKEGSRDLLEKFRVELLVAPFASIIDNPVPTREALDSCARSAIKKMENALFLIHQQYSSRSTCLLLPAKNFGPKFSRIVVDAVHKVISHQNNQFIKNANDLLSIKQRRGPRKFKINNIEFNPAFHSGMHGVSPLIGDTHHDLSCGVRGRLRFGVPYNPRFHYDCKTGREQKFLDDCHGPAVVTNPNSHVNIAPNDNIRK